jgi:hypothetical protein
LTSITILSSTPSLDDSDLVSIRGIEVIMMVRVEVAVDRDEATMGVTEDSEARTFTNVPVESGMTRCDCTSFLFIGCV